MAKYDRLRGKSTTTRQNYLELRIAVDFVNALPYIYTRSYNLMRIARITIFAEIIVVIKILYGLLGTMLQLFWLPIYNIYQ